jgi:hypothetical protein
LPTNIDPTPYLLERVLQNLYAAWWMNDYCTTSK